MCAGFALAILATIAAHVGRGSTDLLAEHIRAGGPASDWPDR
ncbi:MULTISPECIES: hypothetical protein [Amycolatopsis]|uniref:Uncharacterized protein n=1 Tax=Amycolatopsis rubida TaxID=112413 RepID=A0A1I5L078_9PSEU|nr:MULTISPECIES: hypothetical protein [Amycolatopsis]OAP22003.1 hypothetical protein A4R44_07461 [Amycolatopsis sp. M39]SFO90780.1 hypothetical protein SAMN05421854_103399 [Amycolatopsis rubida]